MLWGAEKTGACQLLTSAFTVLVGNMYYATKSISNFNRIPYCKGTNIRQEPEFSTSKHYRKAHGSLLSGLMICNYMYTVHIAGLYMYSIEEYSKIDHNSLI